MAIRRQQGERLEIASGKERRAETRRRFLGGPPRPPDTPRGHAPHDRRIPDPPPAGLRHSRRLRHPGRLCAPVLRHARRESDPRDRHAPGRLRGLCRRRLRPHQRHGGRVRHVLRRRLERHQFHRRRVCGEVARDRDQRRSGRGRAPVRSAVAPPRPRFQHAAGGLREDHGRLRPARRSADGVSRDRPLPRGGRPLQAARLPRTSPRPRAQPGALSASGTARKAGQRQSRRSKRPSKTRSA